MPESIKSVLGMMPNGTLAKEMEPQEVASYLYRKYVSSKPENDRRKEAELKNELYNDGGDVEMGRLIDRVFTDKDVRALRKHWIRYAKYQNPTKRIFREISTVYSEPAIRSVSQTENNRRYQEVIRQSKQDQVFARANVLVNLHRAIFVRPRVLLIDGTQRKPAIDIATPADAYAVRHPNDPTHCVAVIVATGYHGSISLEDYPSYEVWTDFEKFSLTAKGAIVKDSWVEHGLGMNPWRFLTVDPPEKNVWPQSSAEDVVAAHLAIWFQNLQALKESKSQNKQNYLQGDSTMLVRGQMADSEGILELPDGTIPGTIDNGVDTQQYRDNANHILEHLANSYGMSAAMVRHQGIQSAEARELMRVPVEELRRDQIKVFRAFEEDFVHAQEAVMQSDYPELGFSADGWSIRFGESRKPVTTKDSLETFKQERELSLTNTVTYLMERHGINEEQAKAQIEKNVETELERNISLRPLTRVSGSMGATVDDVIQDDQQQEVNNV